MSLFEALILGIIQGITEFFPVSSSGHLTLAQWLFGFEHLDQYITFDLVCHLGTLLAVFLVFWEDLVSMAREQRRRAYLLFAATLPLIPIYFILKPLRTLFDSPEHLGWFFMGTAAILFAGDALARRLRTAPAVVPERRYRDALIIGTCQALAVLPGISRSGATISAARALGWPGRNAASFSFLLAIPAILGGMALHLKEVVTGEAFPPALSWMHYGVGFLSSFLVGWLALRKLLSLVQNRPLAPFAWYCLSLGIFAVAYVHLM